MCDEFMSISALFSLHNFQLQYEFNASVHYSAFLYEFCVEFMSFIALFSHSGETFVHFCHPLYNMYTPGISICYSIQYA